MRTPAGKECRYFYGDYYRGRELEECRLLNAGSPMLRWQPYLCQTCPVPEIVLDNSCPHMILVPRLERPFPYIRNKVTVTTFCTQTDRSGFDPHIGCGQCHKLPPIFDGEKEDSNSLG